jgi:group I intron endonuclease
MIGIYKITNPEGKIYIGKSVNLQSRKNDYKRLDCKGQILIFRSLKKYGWENHKFEIIEECSLDKLNKRETHWGKFYNTLEEGLNLKLGEGKNTYSRSSRKKMSMSKKGTKDSLETKQKKSEAAKGKIKTKEHRQNLSKSSTKSFGRKVLQKDLEDNLIKEWDSGKQASQELGLGYTAINNCCRFNAKGAERKRDKDKVGKYTSMSYIWEYKN